MEPSSYISCIKINGVPILPPLITDEIKEEMKYYKQLAIEIEEKLKSSISFNTETESITLDTVYQPTNTTISCSDSVTASTDLNNYLNNSETREEIFRPPVPRSLDIVPIVSNDKTPPKLVRQGSYVLENPSPVLLAHIEKEPNDMCNGCNDTYVPTPSNNNLERRKEWSIVQTTKSLDSLQSVLSEDSKVPLTNGRSSSLENLKSVLKCSENSNRLKLTITPDKLLSVFKEIKELHENQMLELVARQQKEQLMLQKEFEKQQMLLLSQVKKTFPGILLSSSSSSSSLSTSSSNDNNNCKRSKVSRQLFPLNCKTNHLPIPDRSIYEEKHIRAATVITAYARGFLVRRLMKTERVISLKNTYREALHCMLKLHVDAPLNLSELNFHKRLQLQCDAASMSIVELFSLNPGKRMNLIMQDREIKHSRMDRPTSARSYSFATQRTLARKKLKKFGEVPQSQSMPVNRFCTTRSRSQTWASNINDKYHPSNLLHQGIKRSTSAGTVRKPWR